MANVYATKSGVWSDPTVWNTGILPDVTDDVFSNTYTVTIDVSPTVLSIRNTAAAPIVAGGGFNLLDGVVLTGNVIGNQSQVCLTYEGITSATIIGTLANNGNGITNPSTLKKNNGVLSIQGNLITNSYALRIEGGQVNIIGNVKGQPNSGSIGCINLVSSSTLNIVGQITSPSSQGYTISIYGSNCTVNVTGNLITDLGGAINWTDFCFNISAINATLNITGDIDTSLANSNNLYYNKGGINLQVGALNYTINHIGNSIGSFNTEVGGPAVNAHNNSYGYYKQIGYVSASRWGASVIITNPSAINILTGPFISHESGTQPLYVNRMHYQRTIGSYFEFRDDSTNGALPPATPAPATRLVSPETGADLPVVTDVRKGVTYALGTMEGTMNVPDPDNVRKNIPVDQTIGTAVFDPQEVWDVLTANITEVGSIGERLKNVSTVQTTGEQLENLT